MRKLAMKVFGLSSLTCRLIKNKNTKNKLRSSHNILTLEMNHRENGPNFACNKLLTNVDCSWRGSSNTILPLQVVKLVTPGVRQVCIACVVWSSNFKNQQAFCLYSSDV